MNTTITKKDAVIAIVNMWMHCECQYDTDFDAVLEITKVICTSYGLDINAVKVIFDEMHEIVNYDIENDKVIEVEEEED